MKLTIKKKGVFYSVNESNTEILDIADVGTLKEGSFLIAFDNGVVIDADGTFIGEAGEKAFIYHKINGEVQVSAPIYVGKAKRVNPLPDHAPEAKVMTFDIAKPATITESMHTGVAIFDYSKNVMDPTRRDNIDVYTDDATVQADLNVLEGKIANHPLVATCTLAGTVLTITLIAGANAGVIGTGEFEKVEATVTQEVSYGDAVPYADMVEFIQSISTYDGNRDSSIDGIIGTFTRNYGLENYSYLVYNFLTNTSVYSTGKSDMERWGANLYIAIPEGDGPALDTAEGWEDIFNAAITGISLDAGGAGDDPEVGGGGA